jgi:hypothetical protein
VRKVIVSEFMSLDGVIEDLAAPGNSTEEAAGRPAGAIRSFRPPSQGLHLGRRTGKCIAPHIRAACRPLPAGRAQI